VPGVLRLSLLDMHGQAIAFGSLDPGYPIPHKVRQARFILPPGLGWEGLQLKAELEVKGVTHPVRWACRESVNADGSLTLKRNPYL
jgi:hypothetical protein